MARTALTVDLPPAIGGAPSVITEQAADASNFNNFPLTGREIVTVRNSGASAYTITVHSVPDAEGRLDMSITAFSIAAGAVVLLPQFPPAGYQQADGTLWLDGSNALLLFTIVRTEV